MTRNPQVDDGDDMLDLRAALIAVWDSRGWIVAGLFGYFAILVVATAWSTLWMSQPSRWAMTVNLSFSGVREGRYPDGSPFQRGDLLASSVLANVYEINELDAYSISFEDFVDGVGVDDTAPGQELATSQLRRIAEDSNLTPEVRQALDSRLAAKGSEFLNITLTLESEGMPWSITLPRSVASKVLSDIPREWAKRRSEVTGAFDTPFGIVGRHRLRSIDMDRLSGVQLAVMVDEELEFLYDNLAELESQIGSTAVRDPLTGFSVHDLRVKTTVVEGILVIAGLGRAITAEGGGSSTSDGRLVQRRLSDLGFEQELWKKRAKVVENALRPYTNVVRNQASHSMGGGDAGVQSVPVGYGVNSQLDAEFLDRLIDVVRQSGHTAFRQELQRRRLAYLKRVAEHESEINWYQLLLSEVRNSYASQESEGSGYVADIAAREPHAEGFTLLRKIVEDVDRMIQSTVRIAERVTDLKQGEAGRPYGDAVVGTVSGPPLFGGAWSRLGHALLGGLVVAGGAFTINVAVKLVRSRRGGGLRVASRQGGPGRTPA